MKPVLYAINGKIKFKHFFSRKILLFSFCFLLDTILGTQKEAVLEKMVTFLTIPPSVQKAELVVALGDPWERKQEAVNLFKKGIAPKVLFTGSHIKPSYYEMFGIPTESIFDPTPRLVHSTYDEAILLRTMAKKMGLRSILIVTSFFHLKRTELTFRRVFDKSNIQVSFASVRTPIFNEHNWWEESSHRRGIIREYIALAYYWLTV